MIHWGFCLVFIANCGHDWLNKIGYILNFVSLLDFPNQEKVSLLIQCHTELLHLQQNINDFSKVLSWDAVSCNQSA